MEQLRKIAEGIAEEKRKRQEEFEAEQKALEEKARKQRELEELTRINSEAKALAGGIELAKSRGCNSITFPWSSIDPHNRAILESNGMYVSSEGKLKISW